jgi:hypothetical protein
MANDSSTGGYLTPATSPAPLEGQALNRFLQQVWVGITGLDGTLIRPRWQPEPPAIPAFGTDWMAFGITRRKGDTFTSTIHDPTGNGNDSVYRQEVLDILCTFYGPDADNYASLLREGLFVSQNREVLQLNNFGLVEVGEAIAVPELIKERWTYRVDMKVTLRRSILRTYPVLNILSAEGTVDTDPYTIPFTVSE